MPSQYSAENVCVSRRRPRLAHARGGQPRAHQPRPLPARLHRLRGAARHLQAFTPIPILLEAERGYALLRRAICGARSTAAASRRSSCRTPATPPASTCGARSSRRWVRPRARARLHAAPRRVLLALRLARAARRAPVESAARYVEDVDRDPVVIFDGLTKNWRYPGWRVTWTVGPRKVIDAVASAGLVPRRRRLEAAAARGHPAAARRRTSRRDGGHPGRRSARSAISCSRGLARLGVRIDREPEGTFYVWG